VIETQPEVSKPKVPATVRADPQSHAAITALSCAAAHAVLVLSKESQKWKCASKSDSASLK
jgi:hypothetical protein